MTEVFVHECLSITEDEWAFVGGRHCSFCGTDIEHEKMVRQITRIRIALERAIAQEKAPAKGMSAAEALDALRGLEVKILTAFQARCDDFPRPFGAREKK